MITNRKIQTSNSKSQINPNIQISSFGRLEFMNLFEVWCLLFGIYLREIYG